MRKENRTCASVGEGWNNHGKQITAGVCCSKVLSVPKFAD